MKNNYGFGTNCVHGNYDPYQHHHSRAVPLYQSAAFVYDDVDHAADLFSFDREGSVYMRIDNPTVREAEDRLAMLEKGVGAVCFASGMAAATGFILNFLKAGDKILSGNAVYGGVTGLFSDTLPNLGIATEFFDSGDLGDFKRKIGKDVKLVWIENLANPSLTVPDLAAISAVCKEMKIPLAVDNTIATPWLCNPADWGADFVIHSCTKYLEGHGCILGGAVIDCGTFEFDRARYPLMHEAAPGGKSYAEKFGKKAFLTRMRGKLLMNTGGVMAPFHAFLLIHGMESFHLRMERHCANAAALAKFLSEHPLVEWVCYPALEGHRSHELAKKYLRGDAPGAMVGFGVKGGFAACGKFINSVRLLSHTTNIGDTKTLVIHPASTTHRNLTAAERKEVGITDDFIRMTVGIEDIEDLKKELDAALKATV